MTESRDRGASTSGRKGRGFGLGLRTWAVVSCLFAGSAVAGDDWLTNYEAAMEKAREQQKPVLTVFTGSDWCPHCRTLEDQVLHTQTFRNWAEGRLVLLMIDLPKQGISAEERAARSRVCIKYGVRTFPSAVLIGPEGDRITAQSGYLGQPADAWVATLEGHLKPGKPSENPAVAVLDDAVEIAREERRPVLVVVSRPSDSTAKMRMASLVKDPEFNAFARENFVVAEIPAGSEAESDRPEALRSLVGEHEATVEGGVTVIVTDDGQTPLHTESGSQPPQRVVSGLRRFLAARQTTRR